MRNGLAPTCPLAPYTVAIWYQSTPPPTGYECSKLLKHLQFNFANSSRSHLAKIGWCHPIYFF